MSVSRGEDREISEEEQSLFEEVAGDIAFALHSLQLEDTRTRTEDALQLEQSRLEALLRLGQMTTALASVAGAVWSVDSQGSLQAIAQIIGSRRIVSTS